MPAAHAAPARPAPAPSGARPDPRRLLLALAAVSAGALATGLAAMLAWLVPHVAPFLPKQALQPFELLGAARADMLGLHLLAGLALVGLLVAAALRAPPELRRGLAGPTGLGALVAWLLAAARQRAKPRRERALPPLRDALVLPWFEGVASLAVGVATSGMILVPLAPVARAGLALHRVNAVILATLAAHALLVLLARRWLPAAPRPAQPATPQAATRQAAAPPRAARRAP